MKKKFKFQIENGHIYEGSFVEIVINNHIAEIEEADINPAILLVIEAHGGQEIAEKPKRKSKKTKSLTEKEAIQKTANLLEKVNEVSK